MQRGRGDRDDFFGFGDPCSGFDAFGRSRSMTSSFFGGRDPFDDPFFSRPSGSMFVPSIMRSRSMFAHRGCPFMEAGFLVQPPPSNNSTRPIIEEVHSDDEGEGEKADKTGECPRETSRSSKEPCVQHPDEEAEESKSGRIHFRNDFCHSNTMQPQCHSCAFRSSTITYGGPNGAYHTSSTVRRTGGDGVIVEESKEADATTGKAAHRISRGICNNGHTITRRLSSDGRVDMMQTLHNLNEVLLSDELSGFEHAWKGSAQQHLPGWNLGFYSGNASNGNSSGRQEHAMGWGLPSTRQLGRTRSQTMMGFPSSRSSIW